MSSSGSKTTTVRSSMTRRISLRTPRSCSSARTGRVRTATVKELLEFGPSPDAFVDAFVGDVGASLPSRVTPRAGSPASPPRE